MTFYFGNMVSCSFNAMALWYKVNFLLFYFLLCFFLVGKINYRTKNSYQVNFIILYFGCHNKIPYTGCLKQEIYFFIVLEACNPRSGFQQICFLIWSLCCFQTATFLLPFLCAFTPLKSFPLIKDTSHMD